MACFAFIFSYLSATCCHLFVISRYILRSRFWIAFVITRISLNRGSLNGGSVPYILFSFWPH